MNPDKPMLIDTQMTHARKQNIWLPVYASCNLSIEDESDLYLLG